LGSKRLSNTLGERQSSDLCISANQPLQHEVTTQADNALRHVCCLATSCAPGSGFCGGRMKGNVAVSSSRRSSRSCSAASNASHRCATIGMSAHIFRAQDRSRSIPLSSWRRWRTVVVDAVCLTPMLITDWQHLPDTIFVWRNYGLRCRLSALARRLCVHRVLCAS
jgi:hypothetical protein